MTLRKLEQLARTGRHMITIYHDKRTDRFVIALDMAIQGLKPSTPMGKGLTLSSAIKALDDDRRF